MTDETFDDEMIDDERDGATTDWTPRECADVLGVSAKTLRGQMRAYNYANGLPTPGQGGQWDIPVPVDESERAAFFDWLRDDVLRASHGKKRASFGRVTD